MAESYIVKTFPGDENFHFFEKFPSRIYPSESVRFKLSETINEEFLSSCYVFFDYGKPVARAALYNNPTLKFNDKKSFCIGNYEAVNNVQIATDFFRHISTEAKKLGAEFLIGPMNGSTWDDYRFSTHNNHPNFFLEPYHHLYYNEHFLASGFKIISNYFSSIDTQMPVDNPAVLQREKELKSIGVSFRNINPDDFENELKILYDFNAIAFKTNFLYTPISWETFKKKYSEVRKIINPEFVILAQDETKNIISFFFCIDDFFNIKEKSIIVKTIARHPDKKWSGLGHVIGNMIIKRSLKYGYKSMVHAFILEDGTSTKISRNHSGVVYKNYLLYGKILQ